MDWENIEDKDIIHKMDHSSVEKRRRLFGFVKEGIEAIGNAIYDIAKKIGKFVILY